MSHSNVIWGQQIQDLLKLCQTVRCSLLLGTYEALILTPTPDMILKQVQIKMNELFIFMLFLKFYQYNTLL